MHTNFGCFHTKYNPQQTQLQTRNQHDEDYLPYPNPQKIGLYCENVGLTN